MNNIYKFGSTKPVGTVESMNSVMKSYHAEMDELEQKLVAVDENVMYTINTLLCTLFVM